MTEQNTPSPTTAPRPNLFRSRYKAMLAGTVLAVLAIGVAAGAGGTRLAQRWQPRSVMLLQPAPISTMQEGNSVAVRGSVAETFGHFFILQDSSGRALVDLGPRGDDVDAAAKGENVTVQGLFDRGLIHAQVLAYADGRTEEFGPPPPDRGPPPPAGYGPDRGPPPPPGYQLAPRAERDHRRLQMLLPIAARCRRLRRPIADSPALKRRLHRLPLRSDAEHVRRLHSSRNFAQQPEFSLREFVQAPHALVDISDGETSPDDELMRCPGAGEFRCEVPRDLAFAIVEFLYGRHAGGDWSLLGRVPVGARLAERSHRISDDHRRRRRHGDDWARRRID